MTNDTSYITRVQQFRFFFNTPPHFDIFIAWRHRKRAGYLLLRRGPQRTYITEVVSPAFHRMGIASEMLNFAKRNYAPITAHIRPANHASIALHEANGFTRVASNDPFITFHFGQAAS